MRDQQDDIPVRLNYKPSTDPNRGSISLFDDTIEYHVAQGLPYYQAKQRAIDEYRKFSSRQVQGETFDIMVDSYLGCDQPSAEKLIDVNLVFEKLIRDVAASYKKEKDRLRCAKLVCCMFRLYGVDEYLFEDNQMLMDHMLDEFFPNAEYEIAEFLGYKVRWNGSCTPLFCWKVDLARIASKFSLYTGRRNVNLEEDDDGVRAYA